MKMNPNRIIMRIFVDLVIINNSQNRIMDEIVKELHTLKLSGMARLWASLGETKRLDKLTLVDGLMLLLQAKETPAQPIETPALSKADFRYSSTLEQLQASSHRGIDPNMLAILGTGSYIEKGESSDHRCCWCRQKLSSYSIG